MSLNQTIQHQTRADQVTHPGDWVVTHAPGANTQATITKAAPAAGLRHVVTSIDARLVAGASAPTAVAVQVNLIAGASGGTPIASYELAVAATAGASGTPLSLSGLQIEIDDATAVTLEFAAGGGGNTIETVALTGYTKNTVAS